MPSSKVLYPLKGSTFNSSSFTSSSSKAGSTLRIAIIGAPAVGKTALIHQFVYGRFSRGYSATIQERYITSLESEDGHVFLDIFDTPGAYCFSNVRKLAISNADAFVLVYDVGDESSLERLASFRELIMNDRNSGRPVIVVGNKTDNGESSRFISEAKTRCMVTTGWSHTYMETSAEDNDSVAKIFLEVVSQAESFRTKTKPKRFKLSHLLRKIWRK